MQKTLVDKNYMLGTLVCSRDLLQIKLSLFLSLWQSLAINLFQTVFFPPISFPFSCSWSLPSHPDPSFSMPKRILLSRLWSVLKLPCGMTFVKGRDVWASVCNQQLFFGGHSFKEFPSLNSVIITSSKHSPPLKKTLHKNSWLNVIKHSLAPWAT